MMQLIALLFKGIGEDISSALPFNHFLSLLVTLPSIHLSVMIPVFLVGFPALLRNRAQLLYSRTSRKGNQFIFTKIFISLLKFFIFNLRLH